MSATSGQLRASEYEQLAMTTAAELTPGFEPVAMEAVFNLIRAANRITKDLEATVHRPRGISFAGYRVLFSIRAAGRAQPNQLARVAGVATASMSSLLQTMDRNGWIVREPDPNDGRRSLIALSDTGEAFLAELVRQNHDGEQRWVQALTPAETAMLAELMRKLLTFRPDRTAEGGPDCR